MPESAFVDLPIAEFLERLSSDAPAPGGGAAAALVGGLAAALGKMVCALTAGRQRFAGVEPQIRQAAARLTRAGVLLRPLMDEDAAAYGQLHAALKMDKTDPRRKLRVVEAAALAAAVPLETVAVCRHVLEDLCRLAEIGNPNLRADVEAGAWMARAAMHAAAANVRANLPLLDEQQAETVAAELEHLLTEATAEPAQDATDGPRT